MKMPTALARNSEYVLRVRVSDPSTASATVNVIVRVTEVNEPPAFKDDAPTLLSVVENLPDSGRGQRGRTRRTSRSEHDGAPY